MNPFLLLHRRWKFESFLSQTSVTLKIRRVGLYGRLILQHLSNSPSQKFCRWTELPCLSPPPPQDVPARRLSEEFAHHGYTPSYDTCKPLFRGLNHGDGIFASPREVVGNLLLSNLSGSPLSHGGYGIRRNLVLVFAQLTTSFPGSFNTAITFIQLVPRPD